MAATPSYRQMVAQRRAARSDTSAIEPAFDWMDATARGLVDGVASFFRRITHPMRH
jgi:hypothetical protein